MTEVSSRNAFIDSLKGLLILLVVYGHAIQFGGYQWADDWTKSAFWEDPFFKAVYMFHMPLFMGISGYLSFGSIQRLSFGNVVRRRFVQLMVPLISWSVIYQLALNAAKGDFSSLAGNIAHEIGFGLWFLWAAFLSVVLTAALKWAKLDHQVGSLLAFLVVLALPNVQVIDNFKYTFPFFLVGYQIAKFDLISRVKIGKSAWFVIVLMAGTCWILWDDRTYIYISGMDLGSKNFQQVIVRYLSGAILGIVVLRGWYGVCQKFQRSGIQSFGRRSLDIYIVQNFIFVALFYLDLPLKNSPWFSVTLAPALAIVVCIFSVTVGWWIEKFSWVSNLLLGRCGGMKPCRIDGPIALFAHERGDARVNKRIAAFQDLGWSVTGYTFHRVREKNDPDPEWENVHLGTTYNRRYFHRLWTLARSVWIIWKNRRMFERSSVLYVINTDNAVLALIGRWLVGVKVPLVLELADIQPAMYSGGVVGKVLRAVERAVLRRSSLLVTTSPGFIEHYFLPIQNVEGEIFLLENKVYPGSVLPLVQTLAEPVMGGSPWVIGCFGAFRCRRSMQLMHALASRLGDKVKFRLRGYASGTIADDFKELLGDLPNLQFEGPYKYPDDLASMYGEIDLNWSFDETDPGGNSAWLLPNRIYEGGCFGVPVITAKATQTGAWVERHQCGWTLGEPLEERLFEFLNELDANEWRKLQRVCAAIPRSNFTGESDYEILSGKLRDVVKAAWAR